MILYISLGTLLIGFVGMAFIIGRKLPEVNALPENKRGSKALNKKVREWMKERRVAKYGTSPDLLLQQILSRSRVAFIRAESMSARWLETLRRRNQEKRTKKMFSDYFNSIKKKRTKKTTVNKED